MSEHTPNSEASERDVELDFETSDLIKGKLSSIIQLKIKAEKDSGQTSRRAVKSRMRVVKSFGVKGGDTEYIIDANCHVPAAEVGIATPIDINLYEVLSDENTDPESSGVALILNAKPLHRDIPVKYFGEDASAEVGTIIASFLSEIEGELKDH